MNTLLLWGVISVLVLSFKDAEPQIVGALIDCIKNKYKPPEFADVQFHVYTRNNKDSAEILHLPIEGVQQPLSEIESIPLKREGKTSDPIRPAEKKINFQRINSEKTNLKSKYFNTLDESKILIHGFNQTGYATGMQNMKNAYLTKGSYNVIVVDWSAKSKSPCYPRVTLSLPEVGRIVAKFLDLLVVGGASLRRIHVIGFSLGAHIAGHTGTSSTGRLGRITGLDPAWPLIKASRSLDAADAYLVDLIHTATNFYGKGKPLGHVDFYPNGGKEQPGCSKSRFDACSHGRAVQFFIESINSPKGFPATKCNSWKRFLKNECNETDSQLVLMGDPCPNGLHGRYFLRTGDKAPFTKQE